MDPQNSTVPIPPLPKKNNLVVILLSVLLLISISVSIFLALQVQSLTKQLSQLQIQPTSTPLSTQTPFPTPNPTADWKTYANDQFGFEFKCPPTSIHTTHESTKDGIKLPYSLENCSDKQNLVSIAVMKMINREKFTLDGKTKELSGAFLKPVDYRESYLDGKKMIVYRVQNSFDQIESSAAEIALDDKYISIHGYSQNYFDQILSTFKFTD